MGWVLETDVEAFAERAAPLLAADPLRHTVLLTVVDGLRAGRRFGEAEPLFGTWRDAGGVVRGAFGHTAPHPVVLGPVPVEAVDALAEALVAVGHHPLGVTGSETGATAFARAWAAHAGAGWRRAGGRCLYRLGASRPPDPPPAGHARPATPAEQERLERWWTAFGEETGQVSHDAGADVADRMSFGGILVWEAAGEVVAAAARHRRSAGMVRIGPVYTPPDRRGRGYAAAVTAALAEAQVAAGAEVVCLFTDADNALTNRLYPRIGFELVDRLVDLQLSAPSAGGG